jgi:hypothetical protein
MIFMRVTKIDMKILLAGALVFLFTVLLLNSSISADESEVGHVHVDLMGLFLGNSHHGGETGFSIGLDYEYLHVTYSALAP